VWEGARSWGKRYIRSPGDHPCGSSLAATLLQQLSRAAAAGDLLWEKCLWFAFVFVFAFAFSETVNTHPTYKK